MSNAVCILPETYSPDPDHRIAAEVMNGNHQAFNQLVERYWGRIFARVYQLLQNREDAEEVTQDTFNKAFENIRSFRWEASFSTWLFQIGSNLARNRFWHRKRRGYGRELHMEQPLNEDGFTIEDMLPDHEADPGDRLRWNEFSQQVNHHLDKLPETYRDIMQMRLMEDLSYEEISELLNVPMGTVKSRIARARKHLNRSLGIGEDENVQAHAMELGRPRS
jgi:RNA polymerase sigma-70 factor (ECF subfamily)